ncbi:MAG: hypothetical protein QT02_C0010G0034 [archaeon GW2011_AR9]|nr:MAG: hypothetical protein QT02_C0010G0034 [archaeon GW2011_AR9]
MCRMLIAIGNMPSDAIIDGMIKMASDRNTQHELNQNVLGTFRHGDGWGVAYFDSQGKWRVKKSTQALYEDPSLNSFRSQAGRIVLIHARKKTKGNISLMNTHPFHASLPGGGDFVFAHNGTINDKIKHHLSFKVQGSTDSEQLFYALLSTLHDQATKPTVEALHQTLAGYEDYIGTNIILASMKTTFVATKKPIANPWYYQMSLGMRKDGVIVSSEPISLAGVSWSVITAGDIVEIDNATLAVKIHTFKDTSVPQNFLLVKSL